MPLIPKEHRDRLLVQTDRPCPHCGDGLFRNYCRQCDEFFFVCACGAYGEEPSHADHRTYLCQATPACYRPVSHHCPACDKLLCSECLHLHSDHSTHPMGQQGCTCFFMT